MNVRFWEKVVNVPVMRAGVELMLRYVFCLGVVAVWFGGPHTAEAQWWGNYYHSSTYGESILRGSADVIRAAGMYNVRNSEAAKNWQAARSAAYDNRVKAASTFVEVKEMQRAYQKSLRRPVPTSEQMFRMSKMEIPKRLTSRELDPVTGKIAWPLELTADEYAPFRDKIESLYADRAANGGRVSLDQYREIHNLLDDMKNVLSQRLEAKKVFPQDWTKAAKFLKQLRYELKYTE